MVSFSQTGCNQARQGKKSALLSTAGTSLSILKCLRISQAGISCVHEAAGELGFNLQEERSAAIGREEEDDGGHTVLY